jgi:hypothetical protein
VESTLVATGTYASRKAKIPRFPVSVDELGLSVALCSGFNGQPGTYALGNNCGGFLDFVNFGFFTATTGSLELVTFNSGAGTASGTFWYEASDGFDTILVTNGMFSISNLLTSQ